MDSSNLTAQEAIGHFWQTFFLFFEFVIFSVFSATNYVRVACRLRSYLSENKYPGNLLFDPFHPTSHHIQAYAMPPESTDPSNYNLQALLSHWIDPIEIEKSR